MTPTPADTDDNTDDGPTTAEQPVVPSVDSTPAADWAEVRLGSGVEPPDDIPPHTGPRTVIRTFAFLDLCGSTEFLEREGTRASIDLVSEFRALVREVSARRGVRVAKWLGDGAMLVGVRTGPVLATATEICSRQQYQPLPARAGVAVSPVLLFDGDDYLGRAANFAARICDDAPPGRVLCDQDCADSIPEWVEQVGAQQVSVRGMGTFNVLVLNADARTTPLRPH